MAVRLLRSALFTATAVAAGAAGVTTYNSRFSACSHAAVYERVKEGLREVLLAPRHAVFPELSAVRIDRAGACSFEVRGYVDSANLLGVLLRADYRARIDRDDSGQMLMRLDRLSTRQEAAPQVLPPPGAAAQQGGAVGPESVKKRSEINRLTFSG